MGRRYLIISPCRDESAYLETTIASVAAQTVPPAKWIVVDDGSTDDTYHLLCRAALRHPFIEIVRRENRGSRAIGPGVVEAFNAGLEAAGSHAYDYICKLDCDLELPADYFETLMIRCESEPSLGTVSGKLWFRKGQKFVEERCGDENSVGPAKFYRMRCFRDIGGFKLQLGWDGIDGHLCRMKGWNARSINDPRLRIVHLRRMGSSDRSIWVGRMRWGRSKYLMGSSFWYTLVSSVYRMRDWPYVLGGAGIMIGYITTMLKREKRCLAPEYVRFLRKYELSSLVIGKARTIKRYPNTKTPESVQIAGL